MSKPGTPPQYWLTRFVILRLLGTVYAVAFLAAVRQLPALIGSQGLMPAAVFLQSVREHFGSAPAAVARVPSLFWIDTSDAALQAVAWSGLAIACIVAAGYANALMMAALWLLYMSIVRVGQDWYGYGWEIQLLETGFLAIFLCPLLDGRPFPRREPPRAIVALMRWLIFRIMLGAGLIKLRGDPVWRDLTALDYHFETQPLPNPLSRWFHFLPRPALRAGVAFNHLAELVAPWLMWIGGRARYLAGVVIVAFQLTLILSGNLSFLNWLTIVPALACFDDAFWRRLLPAPLVRRSMAAQERAEPSVAMRRASLAVTALVVVLSLPPAFNMLSASQIMNTSFDPLALVNTYGAFGTVGKVRMNVIFEGTHAVVPDERALWQPYRYVALPVDVDRMPPLVAPYQPRLDWQMWFASMSRAEDYPWTLHLVWKLLHGDEGALSLFAENPFPNGPPRFIRATQYRYEFADPDDEQGRWWNRERVRTWLPPLAKDDPRLQRALEHLGFLGKAPD
ncbi:MAG TPA: lipase maturation factor family protein [Candidatus Limnocylindrales bacterium]|nr:lipase maturation factor family protein [Candidatus Limnocylindrales bacterium]